MRFVHRYLKLFIIIIIYILILIFLPQYFGIYHTRGKEFSNYWPRELESEGGRDKSKWWRERLLIYGLNKACSNIASSYLKVEDCSMSAIKFCTTSKRNLPHLYYIF